MKSAGISAIEFFFFFFWRESDAAADQNAAMIGTIIELLQRGGNDFNDMPCMASYIASDLFAWENVYLRQSPR